MKHLLSFFIFLCAVCGLIAGALDFIIRDWLSVKMWLIDNHVLSFSNEGISLIVFDNFIGQFRVILTLSVMLYIFYTYKFLKRGLFKSDYSHFGKTLFFFWLSMVLMITYKLTTPLDGYQLITGLVTLLFLVWILYKTISSEIFKAVLEMSRE